MIRFAVEEENGLPASPFDSPKIGELRFPTGLETLTLLKTFRALTPNVKL